MDADARARAGRSRPPPRSVRAGASGCTGAVRMARGCAAAQRVFSRDSRGPGRMTGANGRIRVAVCADFREEAWPSMDRVANELLAALAAEHATTIEAVPVCPPFSRRATRLSSGGAALNIDRGL